VTNDAEKPKEEHNMSPGTPRVRASTVVVERGRLLAVALEDPETRRTEVYLPGGSIEPDETPSEAARRETREETGYHVTVNAGTQRVRRYPFTWGGVTYDCTTYFYAATIADPDAPPLPVDDAVYHRGVVWIALGDLRARFGYHAGILQEILALVPNAAVGAADRI